MPKLITRSDNTPKKEYYTYLSDPDGSGEGKCPLSAFTELPLFDTTVTFTSGMTTETINNTIDSLDKYIPFGSTLTLQFENGTYSNLGDRIAINDFYGGGQLFVQGDTTQTNGLHTNHNVHLDLTGDGVGGIQVISCHLGNIQIQHLRITTDDGEPGVIVQRCDNIRFYYNYLSSVAKTSTTTRGLYITDETSASILNNYFSNQYYAMEIRYGFAYSNNNDDTGTQPTYGIRAVASSVGKNGTQPSGSTANELAQNGAEIRS